MSTLSPPPKPGVRRQAALLGVDIGGTRVKFAWFESASHELLGSAEIPTVEGETNQAIPRFAQDIVSQVKALEREHGLDFTSIGVAAPGIASRDERSIAHMVGRLTGLQGLDWSHALGRAQVVPVSNDAHAALVGEIWKGAGASARHVVMLTLGTGVGGAVALDGRVLLGHLGRAGHLGHVTVDYRGVPDIVGTPGSLEDHIGEASLEQRSNGRFRTTAELILAVRSGDQAALQIWGQSLDSLAAALVSFINTFDPELILLGGGIANANEVLFDPLSERLAVCEWRPHGAVVKLKPASLRGWAGAFGAALIGQVGSVRAFNSLSL